jgi:hypothetical protein
MFLEIGDVIRDGFCGGRNVVNEPSYPPPGPGLDTDSPYLRSLEKCLAGNLPAMRLISICRQLSPTPGVRGDPVP